MKTSVTANIDFRTKLYVTKIEIKKAARDDARAAFKVSYRLRRAGLKSASSCPPSTNSPGML